MTDTHRKCHPCGGRGRVVDPESWAPGGQAVRSVDCERCKGEGWVPVGVEAELEAEGQSRLDL